MRSAALARSKFAIYFDNSTIRLSFGLRKSTIFPTFENTFESFKVPNSRTARQPSLVYELGVTVDACSGT
jgi:hypothetical protein